MYSIVLLSAMSAGADVTPPPVAVPVVVGAPVAYGCCGAVPVGCSGYSCSGYSCSGMACYGSSFRGSCHGGGFLGLRGHHARHSCNGCSGSAYSCSGYSCFGSCHGCAGAFGCGYGSSWGPPVGMPPYTLHGYNSGAAQVYGPGFPVVLGSNYVDPQAVYGTTINPNRPPVVVVPVAPAPKPGSDAPMGANLRFTLPADAKLFVDGKPAPGTGAERSFYTPPLAAGQKFFYEVKAELVIDGKTVTEEKRVIVEAGANLSETFPKLVAAKAGATGTVAGK